MAFYGDEEPTFHAKRHPVRAAASVLIWTVRMTVVALLWALVMFLTIGSIVLAIHNDSEGTYREATVLDTWSKTSCGMSGSGSNTYSSCTTRHEAKVSYKDKAHADHTATISGDYEVGERTSIFVGPHGVASSRWTAIIIRIATGFALAWLVGSLASAIGDWSWC
jgi:hypothetical protein